MKTGRVSDPDHMDLDYISILLNIFIEDATKLHQVYIIHENRQETTSDIIKALKVRAYYGSEFWSRPDIQEKIEETRKELIEGRGFLSESIMISEGSEGFEGSEGINESSREDSEDSEDFIDIDGICSCDICFKMNNINLYWDQWAPTEVSDQILKKAINKSALSINSNDDEDL